MSSGTGVVVAAVPASFSLTPRKNSGLDGRGHWQAADLGPIEVVNQHEPRPVPLLARELELQERVGPEGQHTTRTASAAKSWRSRVNRTPLDAAGRRVGAPGGRHKLLKILFITDGFEARDRRRARAPDLPRSEGRAETGRRASP